LRYKKIFIFVEGYDDLLFFEKIIKPLLSPNYKKIFLIQHARMKFKNKYKFINSIKEMNADYLYVVDIDYFPCVQARKQDILRHLENVEPKNIIVVIKEIESWYLAGIGKKRTTKLKIPLLENTNFVTKEYFNAIIPNSFNSRHNFMNELLKKYDILVAAQKNESFAYFLKKNNILEY
jgi:hypothetical protein